jgi:hypothetical protein
MKTGAVLKEIALVWDGTLRGPQRGGATAPVVLPVSALPAHGFPVAACFSETIYPHYAASSLLRTQERGTAVKAAVF